MAIGPNENITHARLLQEEVETLRAEVESGGGGGGPVVKLWNSGTNSYTAVVGGTIFLGGPTDPTTKPGDIWIEGA